MRKRKRCNVSEPISVRTFQRLSIELRKRGLPAESKAAAAGDGGADSAEAKGDEYSVAELKPLGEEGLVEREINKRVQQWNTVVGGGGSTLARVLKRRARGLPKSREVSEPPPPLPPGRTRHSARVCSHHACPQHARSLRPPHAVPARRPPSQLQTLIASVPTYDSLCEQLQCTCLPLTRVCCSPRGSRRTGGDVSVSRAGPVALLPAPRVAPSTPPPHSHARRCLRPGSRPGV